MRRVFSVKRIVSLPIWIIAAVIVFDVVSPCQGHSTVVKSPVCHDRFENIVVPNACLGQFRHGTQVFKDAAGNLSVTKSPNAELLTHPGIDLVASKGSPIYAFADGVVEDVVNVTSDRRWGEPQKRGLGYAVLIHHSQKQHGNETYSIYLHMNQPPSVSLGQKVSSGKTLLGYIGETGAAWGYHTHFEIRHFGSFVLSDSSWNSPPNIYGKNDQRSSAVFLREWENPEPLLLNQQPASPSARRSGQEPSVEVTATGVYKVHFNEAQSATIKAFLGAHPGFQLANCESLGMTDSACRDLNKEWERIAHDAATKIQAPFVTWGDFNHDGSLDLALPFFGRNSVNNYGWRDWLIVVLQGSPDGHLTPIIAARDQWGVCFDGMLYHPVRKQIEYWCGSGGGSIRWNGSHYVMKRLIGD
jgi:hypothetical protein